MDGEPEGRVRHDGERDRRRARRGRADPREGSSGRRPARARTAGTGQERRAQAAKEELRSIVKARNDAFALEAFFTELSRRALSLDGGERANLEARIQTARELAGGHEAVDRFLKWKLPPAVKAEDEDAVADEAGDDIDDLVDEDD